MAWIEKKSPSSISDFSGIGKSSLTSVAEKFYELEPAMVIQTFESIPGKVKLITIISKIEAEAYPLNENIKITPLVGELVVYSNYKLSSDDNISKNFYTPLSWWNSTHTNDLPFLLDSVLEKKIGGITQASLNPSKIAEIPERLSKNETGKYFKRDDTQVNKKLMAFEGDVIFEGRNGQSIRFGGAIAKNFMFNNESSKNLVKASTDTDGGWIFSESQTRGQSPLIIISSGKSNFNSDGLTLESIQKDPSTILLSEGGPTGIKFPFLLSAILNKPIGVNIPTTYNGNTILLNSDILIFNSKVRDIILSSNNNIIGMSDKNIYFKTTDILELDAICINLGENAKKVGQAVAMADDLMEFLDEIISSVLDLKYTQYGTIIPGTDLPLISLQSRLKKALSKNGKVSGEFSSKTTFTL